MKNQLKMEGNEVGLDGTKKILGRIGLILFLFLIYFFGIGIILLDGILHPPTITESR